MKDEPYEDSLYEIIDSHLKPFIKNSILLTRLEIVYLTSKIVHNEMIYRGTEFQILKGRKRQPLLLQLCRSIRMQT